MTLGALLATAALLAGCTSVSGPLGDAGDHGYACAPARPGQTFAFGNWWLHNTGQSVVTRTTTRTGRSGGPVIGYSAGGSSFTLAENFGEVLADKCFPTPPQTAQSAASAATGAPGDGLLASAR